jgi:hypothetical protein
MTDAEKTAMRAQAFAAKWSADEHTEDPTDDALREAFKTCVKPPKPDLYPSIREKIRTWR